MARTLKVGPGSGRVSRLRQFANLNLGVIMTSDMNKDQQFRKEALELYDRYYENTQYEDLQNWEEALKSPTYVPIRSRKPRIIYNIAKVLVDKVASKLVGQATFPTFSVEEDPDDTEFFRTVIKGVQYRRRLIMPIKYTLLAGSCFVRYFLVNGALQIEAVKSKYCYPVFDAVGELDSIEIKYVYEDENDKKANGDFKKKWFAMQLTKDADILFDNPDYKEGVKPEFNIVEKNNHALGWVQGEWFDTGRTKHNPDGPSLIGDILPFIDDMNYSLSQSSQAVGYNQEPQLTIKGIDEDEIESLIRSSQKAWNLGRDGEAMYLETDMKGVEQATSQREDNRNRMLDVVRVILHDPEKFKAGAQSGAALEALNAPLVELVDEMRSILEPNIKNLLIKISLTILQAIAGGADTVIQVPLGYMPKSMDLTMHWPAIFPPTIADIAQMSTAASAVAMANLISRESLTRWLAPVFGVENIDEELEKIAAQPPPPNPFGDSGGGF